jgi:hypothetical protein
MQTRKFIYYFFLFVLTGVVDIIAYCQAVRDGGLWNWAGWVILLVFVVHFMNKVEQTFKSEDMKK